MSQPDSDNSESDVAPDPKVASSRAGKGDDGDYVGRTGADDDFDADRQSGAEARSQQD